MRCKKNETYSGLEADKEYYGWYLTYKGNLEGMDKQVECLIRDFTKEIENQEDFTEEIEDHDMSRLSLV